MWPDGALRPLGVLAPACVFIFLVGLFEANSAPTMGLELNNPGIKSRTFHPLASQAPPVVSLKPYNWLFSPGVL